MLCAQLLVLNILLMIDQCTATSETGSVQHGAGMKKGGRGMGLNIHSLAAISLSVFPVFASVTDEAASISARPLLLTHMSKATSVTLVTSLQMDHIHQHKLGGCVTTDIEYLHGPASAECV